MKRVVLAAAMIAANVNAASIEAGRAVVDEVCAACHGLTGVSVSDAIPHLAGQRASYIESQLLALQAGTRKNGIMSPIAAQLSRRQIADIAAYFAAQNGPASGARSEFMPHVARTSVAFPADRATFVEYHRARLAAEGQNRTYFANRIAVDAAKEGRELPDGSILFAEVYSDGGQLLHYRVMARGPGWGREMPTILRNGDWNYAVFSPDRQLRRDVNHAECLACHKPQEKESFAFTLKELAEAARRAN